MKKENGHMRKFVAMFSIAAMLGSTIGTTNYGVVKAADVAGDTVDTVSAGAVKPEGQTPTASPELDITEDDEIKVGDFILDTYYDDDGEAMGVYIWAYRGNSSKVIVPDTYKDKKILGINSKAFSNHTELEEVQLPASLKTICSSAFQGCTNLKKIEIPDAVTQIYEYAFYGCTNLKTVQLPKSLKKVDSTAFQNTDVRNFTIDNENTAFTAVDGVIYNKKCTQLVMAPPRKEKLNLPKTVTKINSYAVYKNKILTEVNFPNTLKIIGESAFEGCTALTEVKFPNTLTTIGWDAFKNCKKIKNIMIPASVSYHANSAFVGCSNLKTFKVNSKNKKYSAYNGDLYNKNKTIFYAVFTNTETFTLPKSVKTVSEYAFSGRKNLKKIKVEKGNRYFSVYDNALYNKKKTVLYDCPEDKTSIILPATLTTFAYSYEYDDFYILRNSKLKKIQVKAANKKYSSYKGVLYNKKKTELLFVPMGLNNIVIPKTLTSDIRNIKECYWVTSISVDAGNKNFQAKNGILYNKDFTKVVFCTKNKEKVVLPKTVKGIEDWAFFGCEKLKNITFSENLEWIGGFAFGYCESLEYVKYPDRHVFTILLAFYNCSSLKWVYVSEGYFSEDSIGDIFAGCDKLSDIYYAGTEEQWLASWDEEGTDVFKYYPEYMAELKSARFPALKVHYEAKAPL